MRASTSGWIVTIFNMVTGGMIAYGARLRKRGLSSTWRLPILRSSPNVLHEIDLAQSYKRHILPLWIVGNTSWADIAAFGLSRNNFIDLRTHKYRIGLSDLIQEIQNLLDGECLPFEASRDFSSFSSDTQWTYN